MAVALDLRCWLLSILEDTDDDREDVDDERDDVDIIRDAALLLMATDGFPNARLASDALVVLEMDAAGVLALGSLTELS